MAYIGNESVSAGVGGPKAFVVGMCYLHLVKPPEREEVARRLRAWPSVEALMELPSDKFFPLEDFKLFALNVGSGDAHVYPVAGVVGEEIVWDHFLALAQRGLVWPQCSLGSAFAVEGCGYYTRLALSTKLGGSVVKQAGEVPVCDSLNSCGMFARSVDKVLDFLDRRAQLFAENNALGSLCQYLTVAAGGSVSPGDCGSSLSELSRDFPVSVEVTRSLECHCKGGEGSCGESCLDPCMYCVDSESNDEVVPVVSSRTVVNRKNREKKKKKKAA